MFAIVFEPSTDDDWVVISRNMFSLYYYYIICIYILCYYIMRDAVLKKKKTP